MEAVCRFRENFLIFRQSHCEINKLSRGLASSVSHCTENKPFHPTFDDKILIAATCVGVQPRSRISVRRR